MYATEDGKDGEGKMFNCIQVRILIRIPDRRPYPSHSKQRKKITENDFLETIFISKFIDLNPKAKGLINQSFILILNTVQVIQNIYQTSSRFLV